MSGQSRYGLRPATLLLASVICATARSAPAQQATQTPTPTQTPIPAPGFVKCDIPLGGAPSTIAVGDFNHDGNADLAIVDTSTSQVQVRLTDRRRFQAGDCSGAIRCVDSTKCSYPAGDTPVAITAA